VNPSGLLFALNAAKIAAAEPFGSGRRLAEWEGADGNGGVFSSLGMAVGSGGRPELRVLMCL
jgi:hypothetical protein